MANEYKGVSCIVALQFHIDQSSAMTQNLHVTVPIDAESANVDGDAITMPFDGAIVGISLDTETAGATDNLMKAYATIGGAEIDGYAIQTNGSKHCYVRYDPTLYEVSAGDLIGAEIVSDGSTGTPTPNMTVVTVYIQIGRSLT